MHPKSYELQSCKSGWLYLVLTSRQILITVFYYFSRGGGIGGLTLAVALSKLELQDLVTVSIYEASSVLAQVGAGIALFPRGWEILKEMGLEEGLLAKLGPEQEKPTLDKESTLLSYVCDRLLTLDVTQDYISPPGRATKLSVPILWTSCYLVCQLRTKRKILY